MLSQFLPMKPTTVLTYFASAFLLTGTSTSGGDSKGFKAPLETPEEKWELKLAVPGWIAGVEGDTGLQSHVSHVDIKADQIIRRVDMTGTIRTELSKGRFGLMGDFIYLSMSDGIGTKTVVKKLDVQLDEIIGELGLRWRVLETERCSLDILGGVRYVNIHQAVALQPNDPRIDEVSTALANAGTLLRLRLARELVSLSGADPNLPIAPLTSEQASRLASAIGKLRGNTAERREKIAELLHDSLNRRISRTDDWWDPYIGLRGRINLNSTWYVSAKGDIGGFGVGSDLAWQAEGVIGVQLSPRHYAELGYRALAMDYDKDGLIMDTVTHGAIATLGISF